MSTHGAVPGSRSALRRMTDRTFSTTMARVAGSAREGGGPGSMGGVPGATSSAKEVTWPQCEPMKFWTLLVTWPFWVSALSIRSGCHRSGSTMVAPVSATGRGSLTTS